ncbi:MAG TPA: carboxypeptidase regulatory-like domain-containing protein, partial [Actinomycetota bacterium]|nr:carboxypeptidase regulatory-like domain-containing protein [Actinomycetota bacterium]
MTRRARFLVALGIVVPLCVWTGQASADTPLAWSQPQLVDHQLPFSGNRYVSDIDCPSASLCVAVDEDGNILSSTDPTGGIEDWDIASVFPGQTLGDISCASASLCVAVGEEGRIFSSTEPAEGATAWDAVETDPERFLEGVSCPSASLCVAVDDDGNALSSTDPTGNAGAWHRASVTPGTIMRDVSCRSVSLCVAVGDGGVAIVSTNPTGNAGAWHQGDSDLESGLTSVSCPTTSLCMAAGEQGEAIASTDPASPIVPWSTVSIEPGRYMTAISCPSETLCVIAAAGGRILASTDPTDDASWSSVEADSENFLGSMSCPSASLCVAGDGAGNVITSTNPGDEPPNWAVVNVDGFNSIHDISCPAESLCVAVDGSGNALVAQAPGDESGAWALANIDPGNSLSGVSCLPAPLCVAVDEAGNVLTSSNPVGGAATWSPPINIAGGDELTAVSCASTILCAAVDAAGNVHTSSDPTGGAGAWNSAQIAAGEYLGSVFCRPTSFCAAVDGAGNAFTSANPTGGADHWHTSAASPDAPLFDIACPSTSLCVAVGVQGTIATSTNPTSVSPAWNLTEVETEGLHTLTCLSPALCVAASGEGDVVTSTDPLTGSSWEVTHIGDFRAYAEDRRPISCPSLMLCMMATTDGRVLRGTPTSGSLAGTVTDSSTSAAIPGVLVCAQNSFEEQCETTDEAGEYTIAGLAEGFWRVQFAPPYSESTYVTQYYSGVSSISDAAIVGITPGAAITAIDAQLQEGGRIAGKVIDTGSKGPVFNSLVCAFHASDEEFDRCTSTDSDGEYTLTGLATGYYKLRFSSPTTGTNYIEQHYNGKSRLQEADEVAVTAGDTTSGIDVELEEASRIEGTVTDASSEEEIQNAEVCLFKEAMDGDFIFQECTYTGGSGEYTLSGLRTGVYKIEFHTDGGLNYVTQFYEGKASLEDADPISVTAGVDVTGIDAEMRRGAQIKGKAIDAVSKAPIPGLEICVYRASDGEQESCTGSDGEGEYTLGGLETGAYKVGFFSIDYEEGTHGLNYVAQFYEGKASLATAEPISVTAGLQTTGIDAEMHEGGRIEGEVIDAVSKDTIQGITVCAFKVGETEAVRCSFSNAGG